MTKLLALETSGALCSVAIHADGIWTEDTQNVQRLHNQVLLQQIDDVTRRAGIGARAFELIAFGAGPGSFTGVRIAAAAAQALAFAGAGQVVPVRSSHALAEALRQSGLAADAPGIVTVIRSRRDAHYIAAYAFVDGTCRPVIQDTLHQGTDVPELDAVRGWPAVGDRPPWWDAVHPSAPFIEGISATAAIIGRLALAIHAAGGAVVVEFGLPIYVTGDSPWRPSIGRVGTGPPGAEPDSDATP